MSIPLEDLHFKSERSKDSPYLTAVSCRAIFQSVCTADTYMYEKDLDMRNHIHMTLQESLLQAVYGDIKKDLHELFHLAMSGSNFQDRHRINQLYHSMISNMGVIE